VTLSVCATPIGNLEDVTLRVLRELREADVVLCEDTRHTRVLLERHGIRARLLSYHEHNEAKRVAELLPRLAAGERMALVTDAGLPAISDPGARLVDAALEAGIAVTVLPGPSAPETAVVASGVSADGYLFVGFFPRRADDLRALLARAGNTDYAVVGFESPRRLARTLAIVAAVDADWRVAVCRELTKMHEEVVRGSAGEIAELFAGAEARGEIVVVLAPRAERSRSDVGDDAAAAVDELVRAGAPRRQAARVVARLTGASANDLYRSSLEDSP
jgi:16S rRNA (cytidine1402-2'-O)-methyltransferase